MWLPWNRDWLSRARGGAQDLGEQQQGGGKIKNYGSGGFEGNGLFLRLVGSEEKRGGGEGGDSGLGPSYWIKKRTRSGKSDLARERRG